MHVDLGGGFARIEGNSRVWDGFIAVRHVRLVRSLRTGGMPPPGAMWVSGYPTTGGAAFCGIAVPLGP